MTNVPDNVIVEAYGRLGSVWKVAAEVGLTGGNVHYRLRKIGVAKPMRVFTEIDRARLRRDYSAHADAGTLDVLAADLGRTRQFICRQARALSLTDGARPKPWNAVWKYMSEERVAAIWHAFKASPLGLGAYCRKLGYDDLGFSNTMRAAFADEWEAVIELKAPKGSAYRRGREFEYRVRDDLRRAGYFVTRSPQSKSPADLTAIRKGSVLLVQCKRQGACPVQDWNALFDLADSIGAQPVLASIPASGRGVQYSLMIGRKDGSKRRQPMLPMAVAA